MTDFDQICIKIHGLWSSSLCSTIYFKVASPFKFPVNSCQKFNDAIRPTKHWASLAVHHLSFVVDAMGGVISNLLNLLKLSFGYFREICDYNKKIVHN